MFVVTCLWTLAHSTTRTDAYTKAIDRQESDGKQSETVTEGTKPIFLSPSKRSWCPSNPASRPRPHIPNVSHAVECGSSGAARAVQCHAGVARVSKEARKQGRRCNSLGMRITGASTNPEASTLQYCKSCYCKSRTKPSSQNRNCQRRGASTGPGPSCTRLPLSSPACPQPDAKSSPCHALWLAACGRGTLACMLAWLMAHGWMLACMAHGSWLMAHCSWLEHAPCCRGRAPVGPGVQ